MKSKTNRIYGVHSILEAIDAGRDLEKVFVQKGVQSDLVNRLRKTCQEKAVPISTVPKEKLEKLSGKNHQGAFAFVSRIPFYDLQNEISILYEEGKTPAVLCLDRVTDVRNFGAICRSALAFGIGVILVPTKEGAAINEDAIKTSAGALFKLKVCRSEDLYKSLRDLKDMGLKLYGCTEKGDADLGKPDWTLPTAIIMGSEENGIRPSLLKLCDAELRIPMSKEIDSLNVSVATGIILSRLYEQRL